MQTAGLKTWKLGSKPGYINGERMPAVQIAALESMVLLDFGKCKKGIEVSGLSA